MTISKCYSLYSFKVFATKVLLQTPDGGLHIFFYPVTTVLLGILHKNYGLTPI